MLIVAYSAYWRFIHRFVSTDFTDCTDYVLSVVWLTIFAWTISEGITQSYRIRVDCCHIKAVLACDSKVFYVYVMLRRCV
jgi:hypothetical protein